MRVFTALHMFVSVYYSVVIIGVFYHFEIVGDKMRGLH